MSRPPRLIRAQDADFNCSIEYILWQRRCADNPRRTPAHTLAHRNAAARTLLRRVHRLPRILDVRDRLELDVRQLAVHLLDPADIDVLDDIARIGIDANRATRAVGVLPLLDDRHRLVS